MAKKKKKAKPGSTVTKKVTRGPNKGDTVRFKANSASAALPGKLNPKRVVKDVGSNNSSTVEKGKEPIKSRNKSRTATLKKRRKKKTSHN